MSADNYLFVRKRDDGKYGVCVGDGVLSVPEKQP